MLVVESGSLPSIVNGEEPTMKVHDVSLEPQVGDWLELSSDVLSTCCFCGKQKKFPVVTRLFCEKLSKPGEFYCPFCIRNQFHAKSNRNVLMLSFKSVFAYYYYIFYRKSKKLLWMSQIEDYIQAHTVAGLLNPIFHYDPETFTWFVDFEKVGNGKRKQSLEEVLKTVLNILGTFNLYESIPNLQSAAFYEKYKDAIESFYQSRKRPEGKRLLCPSFASCGVTDPKEIPFERMRDFTPRHMTVYP